ncbi:hypothetical protein [Chitinophaga japonensis]|uniref:Uncharacterized protein n=1 Tax=Chitinophaga japonensis TaxID=104662 RepID=A0A562SSI2_CHIJA|nr:hypothetical protein [Chitinophaga japonensis]TWI84068.1 hypothetical protein LX66_4430 [Chitinophaga japonensis]
MKKELFAGIGLGLLTGIIIGLSIAEVTGIILGALTSLLAAFFGLQGSREGEAGNQLIIGTFGFTCVLAIFAGLYMRTHNVLAPSPDASLRAYRAAGFDTSEIKKIVLFRELGLVPEGYTFSKEAKQAGSTVLMAKDPGSLDLCALTEQSTLEDIQQAFSQSGGVYDELQRSLRETVSNPDERRLTLLHLKKIICKQ